MVDSVTIHFRDGTRLQSPYEWPEYRQPGHNRVTYLPGWVRLEREVGIFISYPADLVASVDEIEPHYLPESLPTVKHRPPPD